MDTMTFKENLLQKIKLESLASRVIASIGTATVGHHIDREAMRSLLQSSPYHHRHERDLDLYIKESGEEPKMILVLDNELPIFCSTVDDVVVRRSPRTLEMWKISTIRHILDDSDIKVSTGVESVERIVQDAVAMLDLSYTDSDIKRLALEGMASLAGTDAEGVGEALALFAAMLGYRKPPKYFGLDQTVSYGREVPAEDDAAVFGPLALYRPGDNTLVWLDRTFSRTDREGMKVLGAIAAGKSNVAVKGDAVFEKLRDAVWQQPDQVRARLAGSSVK